MVVAGAEKGIYDLREMAFETTESMVRAGKCLFCLCDRNLLALSGMSSATDTTVVIGRRKHHTELLHTSIPGLVRRNALDRYHYNSICISSLMILDPSSLQCLLPRRPRGRTSTWTNDLSIPTLAFQDVFPIQLLARPPFPAISNQPPLLHDSQLPDPHPFRLSLRISNLCWFLFIQLRI